MGLRLVVNNDRKDFKATEDTYVHRDRPKAVSTNYATQPTSESSIDDIQYYDLEATVGELRKAHYPWMVTHAEVFSQENFFNPQGELSLDRLAEAVNVFYDYFADERCFDRSSAGVDIPKHGSSEYILRGDIYIRNGNGITLLQILEDVLQMEPQVLKGIFEDMGRLRLVSSDRTKDVLDNYHTIFKLNK